MFFGVNGDVFFSGAVDRGERFLYRVREDGSGLQKAIPNPITYVYDASPDGKAVAAWLDGAVQIFPMDGGPALDGNRLCAAAGGENRGITPPCVSWSPDGAFLHLHDRTAGLVYAVPIPRGRNLPALPAGGIASAQDAAALPGTRVIRERHAFPSADPSVYAFFRVTSQRNIYRVSVP